MRLGFLTAPFPETPLMDVADWAAGAGFEVLEIACWPRTDGPTRRYAGTSHIDVANLSASQATEIRSEIEGKGLAISGLGFYPNPLHADAAHREEVIGHLRAVIDAAGTGQWANKRSFQRCDDAQRPPGSGRGRCDVRTRYSCMAYSSTPRPS